MTFSQLPYRKSVVMKDERSAVMIGHENNRVLFFDLFVYNFRCILRK